MSNPKAIESFILPEGIPNYIFPMEVLIISPPRGRFIISWSSYAYSSPTYVSLSPSSYYLSF